MPGEVAPPANPSNRVDNLRGVMPFTRSFCGAVGPPFRAGSGRGHDDRSDAPIPACRPAVRSAAPLPRHRVGRRRCCSSSRRWSPWSGRTRLGRRPTRGSGRPSRRVAARRLRRSDGPRPLDQRRPHGGVLPRHRPRGATRPVRRRAHRPAQAAPAPARRRRRHGGARVALPARSTRPARRPTAGAWSSARTPPSCSGRSRWSGPTTSTQLRVFLLTLTVVDDIVAVTVIGLVYSDDLDAVALAVAARRRGRPRRRWGGWRCGGPGPTP